MSSSVVLVGASTSPSRARGDTPPVRSGRCSEDFEEEEVEEEEEEEEEEVGVEEKVEDDVEE